MKKWCIRKVELGLVDVKPGDKVKKNKEWFEVVFTGGCGKLATLVSEDKKTQCKLHIRGSRVCVTTHRHNEIDPDRSECESFGGIVVSMGGLFIPEEKWSTPIPVGVGHRFHLKDKHGTSDVHAIVYIGKDGTVVTDCNGFTHMFEPGSESLGSCANLHFV